MNNLPNNWNTQELLKLIELKVLPSTKIHQLVEKFSCFDELVESKEFYQAKKQKNNMFEDAAEYTNRASKEIEECQNNQIDIVSIWDEEYPALLKKINYPPIVIYTKGKLQKSDALCLAIVGTRQATVYGKTTTDRFAEFFSTNDIVVVSGLAHGIDTFAHKATIKTNGTTYAVIASGIDLISPSISKKNADKIVDSGGCIISEYKCGYHANLGSFPQRNRIIAGISRAVIVIESGAKGGALITARLAANESREVFAVPGSIGAVKSEGTNNLIRNNAAILVTNPSQVLDDLGLSTLNFVKNIGFQKKDLVFDHPHEEIMYNNINYEPIHIDSLIEKSGVEISDGMVRLLSLEFRGVIKQLPGKYYIRT